MYAKLKDGKLIKFEGRNLYYTMAEGDKTYHISVINPGEEEFAEAGYYKVIADSAQLADENTVYTLEGNTIVPKENSEGEQAHEKTDIQ